MKKFAIVLLVIVFLLCSCTAVPDAENVTPSPTLAAEPTPIPTVEPTPIPTVEPTPVPTVEPTPVPTPTPFIYTGIDAFLDEPEQFIWQNFLLLPGMNTIANNKDLFSEKDLAPASMGYREIYGYDDTGNVFVDGRSYYWFVMQVDQKQWDLDKLADIFGDALGLEYKTEYGGDPFEEQIEYKHAQGSDNYYSDSQIGFNSIIGLEGYSSFGIHYYDTNEVFKSLADECFSSDMISVPEVMDGKQSIVRIGMLYPEGQSTVWISKVWLDLSKDEGEAVKMWLKENGYEVTIEYSEDRIEYILALEDAYYKSISVDVFDIGSVYHPDKKACYLVTFKIDLNSEGD